jgi:hypothetical protein
MRERERDDHAYHGPMEAGLGRYGFECWSSMWVLHCFWQLHVVFILVCFWKLACGRSIVEQWIMDGHGPVTHMHGMVKQHHGNAKREQRAAPV